MSDTVLPVIVVLMVLLGLGGWILYGMGDVNALLLVGLVSSIVLLSFWGVRGNKEIQAALPAAPARVRAYLAHLGSRPDGDILCRVDAGIFLDFGLVYDASVSGIPTVVRCGSETCWVEK